MDVKASIVAIFLLFGEADLSMIEIMITGQKYLSAQCLNSYNVIRSKNKYSIRSTIRRRHYISYYGFKMISES